jgi:uncharacterized membrane protein
MLSVCAIIKKKWRDTECQIASILLLWGFASLVSFSFCSKCSAQSCSIIFDLPFAAVPAPAGAAVFLELLFQGQNAASVPVS